MGIPALIEREHELACFADVLQRTSDGSSGLVVLEGPAGIGKTRLVDGALTTRYPYGV